jgi:hypothetical protein
MKGGSTRRPARGASTPERAISVAPEKPAATESTPPVRRRPRSFLTACLVVAWLMQVVAVAALQLALLDPSVHRGGVPLLFSRISVDFLLLVTYPTWLITSCTLLATSILTRRRVNRPDAAPEDVAPAADTREDLPWVVEDPIEDLAETPADPSPAEPEASDLEIADPVAVETPTEPDPSAEETGKPEAAKATSEPAESDETGPNPPESAKPTPSEASETGCPADPSPEDAKRPEAVPGARLHDAEACDDEIAAMRTTIDLYKKANERLFAEFQQLEERVNSSRLAHADTWFAGLVRDMFQAVTDSPTGAVAIGLLQDLIAVAKLSGEGPNRTREDLALDDLIQEALALSAANRSVKVLVSPFAREVRAHGAALRVLIRCYVESLLDEGAVVTLRATRVRTPRGVDKIRLAFEKTRTPLKEVTDGLVLHGLAVLAGTLIKTESAGDDRFVKVLYLDLVNAGGDAAPAEPAKPMRAVPASADGRARKGGGGITPRSWPRVVVSPVDAEGEEDPA